MSLYNAIEKQFNLGSHLLCITYAKKELIVQKWLQDHVIDKSRLIGFDTETKPQFIKGRTRNKIATIQIAVPDGHCLVYHIIKDHEANHEILESVLGDPNIKKVGAGIHEDIGALHADYSFKLNSTLDISKVVKAYIGMVKDMHQLSLPITEGEESDISQPNRKELIIHYAKRLEILHFEKFGVAGISKGLDIPFNKSKKISISNWEDVPLSSSQLHYAAADSWIVLKAHERILKQLSDYSFPKNHVAGIMDLLK